MGVVYFVDEVGLFVLVLVMGLRELVVVVFNVDDGFGGQGNPVGGLLFPRQPGPMQVYEISPSPCLGAR